MSLVEPPLMLGTISRYYICIFVHGLGPWRKSVSRWASWFHKKWIDFADGAQGNMTGTEPELLEAPASPATNLSESFAPSPPANSFRPHVALGQAKQPLKPGHIIVQRVPSPQAQQQAQCSLNPAPPRLQALGMHLLSSSHLALLRPSPPPAPTLAPAGSAQRTSPLDGVQPVSSVHSSPAHLSARSTQHHQPCSMILQPGVGSAELKPIFLAATEAVVPLPSSALPTHFEDSHRDRSADTAVVVNISDRKVKLTSETDQTSLYALCRRWVRNDMPRKDQPGFWDCMVHLPRPLSEAEAERNEAEMIGTCPDADNKNALKVSPEGPVDKLTKHDLLASHLKRFHTFRKRARKDQIHRISRYRHRLAFLLPPSSEAPRQVVVSAEQQLI